MIEKLTKDRYELTLKGFISGVVDEETADCIMDKLELYMRRHDLNAIVFHDGGFTFEKVVKE